MGSAVWQPWVDNIIASGQFDKCAILSYDFSGLEAASSDYQLSSGDIASIASAFRDEKVAQTHGWVVQGEAFKIVRQGDDILIGRSGKLGMVIAKAKSAYLVGHHGESGQTQAAGAYLQGLADYINKNS